MAKPKKQQPKKPDYLERFHALVLTASADAQQRMKQAARAGLSTPMRLYHVPCQAPADGAIRMFFVGEEIPVGWEPTCEDRLTCGIPYANFYTWIRERAGSAPILGSN